MHGKDNGSRLTTDQCMWCVSNWNMGKHDDSVRGALGKEAWDILIEKTEDGSIGSQHMKDISRALHPRIGGIM